MDVQPQVTFLDGHGNELVVAPPGVPPGASSTDPSIPQRSEGSDGVRYTLPVPNEAAQVRIFIPDS